jgi:hypothetical protein
LFAREAAMPLDALGSALNHRQTGLYADLSSSGRSLFVAVSQSSKPERDKDIDESGLPEPIKKLLKIVRQLKAQIQEKLSEMRRIQADRNLSPRERELKLKRLQIGLNALNGALTASYGSLLKATKAPGMDDAARMKVSNLLS